MDLEARERLSKMVLQLRGTKSRRSFARQLNVTATAVMGWENKTSVPDTSNLTKLATMAGYSLEEFTAYLSGKRPVKQPLVEQVKRQIESLKLREQIEIFEFVSDRLVAIAEAGGR
jgi:transcriptional regulator with XRE-family HTH domain